MFSNIVLKQFLLSAKKHPKTNAFCINGNYFSYEQFVQRIAEIAISIKEIKNSNIALIANDDIDTYASIFAIWFTGNAYVPLNPSTPAERNKSILDQVCINKIINSDEVNLINSLDFERSVDLLNSFLLNPNFDDELAYIFFTSGSTGIPKGVRITKMNIANFVQSFWAMGYEINQNDRSLQMFDLTFDLSVMSFLIPLLKGACVYTIPQNQIKFAYIYELLEDKEITIALMVPSILNYLRPYFNEINCPKLKYSLFCGEALQEDIVDEWSKSVPNARIDNVYGPTEDTIFCTYYTYNRSGENDSHNGILSIGKSMLNNLAVVFNEDNVAVLNNEVGELCLAGSQLTPGYFNNDTLNKSMFFRTTYNGVETQFYKTGDLCSLNENGNLNYIGRKDFQAKIQGFRVELSEVEFYANKSLKEKIALVAIEIKNKEGNSEIAIIFESEKFDTGEIMDYMRAKLPSYMIPTKYYFVKPFPLNANEKIDRKKIKSLIKN